MNHTTTAKLDLLTATGAGTLPTALAGINGFIRAVAGDLPDPASVSVYGFDAPEVAIHFDSLDDLRNWAAYLQVPVTPNDVPQHGAVHHRAEAKWGPINGKMVEFRMVYIEDVPVREAEFSNGPRDCEAGEWS